MKVSSSMRWSQYIVTSTGSLACKASMNTPGPKPTTSRDAFHSRLARFPVSWPCINLLASVDHRPVQPPSPCADPPNSRTMRVAWSEQARECGYRRRDLPFLLRPHTFPHGQRHKLPTDVTLKQLSLDVIMLRPRALFI